MPGYRLRKFRFFQVLIEWGLYCCEIICLPFTSKLFLDEYSLRKYRHSVQSSQDTIMHLPATCRVAFRLNADPTEFLATHQYTPSSCSFLVWTTWRKNNEPVDKITTLWDLSDTKGLPSLNHSIFGSGSPSALQCSVCASSCGTIQSKGCSVILGDRYWPANGERVWNNTI